ncbi:MAG: baseplate J/gp47 family protein [Bacteroidales bacterium]
MDTIKDIKRQMTDCFMADERMQALYGTNENTVFEDYFKKVSIESLLFYVVSSVIYLREKAHELWLEDVKATALATRYGTKQWWYNQALNWQKGDSVEVDDSGVLGYEEEDEDKKIIKYAAVVSEGRAVYIRVAKEQGEELVALSNEELSEFQAYINDIKPLGIMAVGQSFTACELDIDISVYYDGQRESSTIESNVKTAIKEYLKGINFGGEMIRNKLIDAMQEVSGVEDVVINSINYNDNGTTGQVGRILQAKAGYYRLDEFVIGLVRVE